MKIKLKVSKNEKHSIEITELDSFELDKVRLLLTAVFQYTNVSEEDRKIIIKSLSSEEIINQMSS